MNARVAWCVLALALSVGPAATAQPPGFRIEQVVTGQLNLACAFAFAPDGRLFVVERTTGDIRVVAGGQLGGVWAHVTTSGIVGSEAGLLGIAVDPDFLRNGYVYVFVTQSTSQSWQHVVGRLQEVNGLGTNFTPITTTLRGGGRHVGGPLEFGQDGRLYIASGEAGLPRHAQSIGNPFGKVLRIDPAGTIPADNPLAGVAGADGRIWSHGHRNIFGMAVHPGSGLIWVTENGAAGMDEANRVLRGANYGWPVYEGSEPVQDPFTADPAWTWPQNIAPTGCCFYTGALYPPAFQRALFATGYNDRAIRSLALDAGGTSVVAEATFHAYAGTVLDVADGPDGNLWALSSTVTGPGCDSITRFVHDAAPSPSANLSAVSNQSVGGAVTLGFVATNGDVVVPWLSFSLLPTPLPTPWGSVFVPPDIPLPPLPVTADGRAYLGIPVPDAAGLSGRTLHLQAGVVRGASAVVTNAAALALR